MSTTQTRATLDDLMRFDGKAELIDGKVVGLPLFGVRAAQIVGNLYIALAEHISRTGVGEAFTSTICYSIPRLPSGRETFSPDASYFAGPFPANPMRFLEGAPTFAVEVRSENDFGDAAEAERAAKRVDYFFAGTLVVWDVDPLNETIDCYRHTDPIQPVGFTRGQMAEAEPAVPGWTIPVDDVFA